MKKEFKRIFSVALSCVLLLALLCVSALAASWENHWSAEYIQAALDNGWINAEEAEGAGAVISRADYAKLLWNALGSPEAKGACPFTDVSGEYVTAVTALYEEGVVNGTGGTAFNPNGTLDRQQGITMLARAFELKAENADVAAGYADWADVADWAKDGVAAAVENGLVEGVGNYKLAPAQTMTLGEMAKLTTAAVEDTTIVGVKTIGFVDTDGAKVSTIVVEYDQDMTGADVSAATYQVDNYGLSKGDSACEIGGNPGAVTNVYAEGNCVYIEVNTDYQLGGVPDYQVAMYAAVKQVADITTDNGVVAASGKKYTNYTLVAEEGRRGTEYYNYANDGTHTIENIAEFQLFTKEDGTAFHATNCFEEATGEYVDVDLPYALYVPADYDASKEYALVLQIHDAGFMGDDPMITLTESQGSVNFASAEIQQIVKDEHGLAGIIVVAPQICEELRSTRDNWSLSAAVPATWQLLDSLTEEYNISMDHIYGTGQSMGGMQVVAMAAQRDNYFAGMWANGCQWGTNYNLEDEYNGASYYEAPADGEIIWTKDADGNPVDYRNWYYMISDDNVLITNCAGDKFSTQTWRELDFLYHDLAGTDLIYENYKAIWNPLTASKEEQNAAAKAAMDKAAAESDLGFCWTAFEGGNHMATWIYSHGVTAHYEWLLSQTRESEMERDKLECLTNNFEYAEVQDTSAARELAPDAATGEMVYYATGKLGAGTADYNGCWLKMGNSTLKAPNWKADPGIVSVKTVGFVDTDGAKASTIVVEYNVDLTGAKVSTDMFEVYNYGIAQGDDACEIGSNPGAPINAYVDGNKVIIELNTDYQLGSVCKKYPAAMAAGVTQVKDIVANNVTVKASDKEVGNYEHQVIANVKPSGDVSYNEWDLAKDGTYTIENIAEFQLFTKEDGTAFPATNCFEEATGEYVDVDLPYALYVPADYDASKEYALVVQIVDAGFLGDDPMITLTESQASANFASAEVQQIVKDEHGLAGIIVVAPQISEALRSTRDNWSLSAAVPATWQLLDSLTEEYNISMDHIYGTGQSMGGMQIVAMAAQRDNYFAGIWANGCQWGSNYNLEEPYKNAVYYEAPVDGVYITGVDADGNPVDYRNWYYMLSDDNVLITNCAGDKFSTQTWRELDYLYHDLAGTDLIYENYLAIWNPLTATKEEQNAAAKAVMEKAAAESNLGYVWTAFEGGNHMATWIYSHGVMAHYEWLLSQTQDTIEERGKLECLTNNFEYADVQDTSAARELAKDSDGNMVYYATGKLGAGTADYNGCWLNMGSTVLKAPNWKPEG